MADQEYTVGLKIYVVASTGEEARQQVREWLDTIPAGEAPGTIVVGAGRRSPRKLRSA